MEVSFNDTVASSLMSSSESSLSLESFDSELESDVASISLDDSLESSVEENVDDGTENVEALGMDASFCQPLYDGAKLSTFESYLLIMNYSLRHGLTKQAVSDLLNLVGMHLPTSTVSLYKLKKFFLDLYTDITFKIHYCCSVCHAPFKDAKAVCPHACDGAAMEFLTISIEAQLKRKLEDPIFWKNLQKRFEERDSSCLRDVYDGREYCKHKDFLSVPENVSLIVNTDGVSIFHSSNISLWPIWVAVNELPPCARFSKSNLLLAGLWFGEAKPTMATFLAPFMKEINSLSCKGFSLNTPDGQETTARARLLMCSVDLPAKATILNMKQFNGQYGCSHCEDEGVPRPTTHLHRNWPYSDSSTARTHHGIIANARDALSNNEPEKGIKGASVLCSHMHFDLSTGVVIDIMHCVFLGVMAKTLMKFWFDVSHYTAPYSIRRKLNQCDERLTKIRVPHDFNRPPKALLHIKHWKASEYRSWLLFYSLPVLQGLLPDPYYTHYCLLVAAMHVLLSDSIPLHSLGRARQYLHRFYAMFAELYGDVGCTMNVHLLRHIPECVENWGPLWGYSCFAFESMNGHLKRHYHGTRCMNSQLAFSYVMLQVLPRGPSPMKQGLVVSDCSIIGVSDVIALNPDTRRALYGSHRVDTVTASRFLRATVKGETYYSEAYTRAKSRNSFTVAYMDGAVERYGFIMYFLSLPFFSVAVISPLTPTSNYCHPPQLSVLNNCIIPVVVESSVVTVSVKCLLYKCVCVDLCSSMFVAKPPNQLSCD